MRIHIRKLRAETLLGAYAEERLTERTVVINLAIDYNPARAIASDRLHDALDYAMIEQAILDSLTAQKFRLLESLAEHVARLVMDFPQVEQVTVEIDKPGAMRHADSVSVVHTLKR